LNKQRFKTTLRGKEVDVEMEILSLPPAPIRFSVVFFGEKFEPQPNRKELAFLCREAEKNARNRQADNE
jgi:hypothetical protein